MNMSKKFNKIYRFAHFIDCQCEDDNIERWLPAGTSGDEKNI